MLLVALGCANPASDLVTADAALAALPGDVSVVVRLEARALRDAPAVRDALAGAGVDLPAIDAAIADAGGPTSATDVERITVGCGPEGCVALVDGPVGRVGAARAKGLRFGPVPGGLDGRTPLGERLVVRQLSPDKAVVGDRAAARAAWRVARGQRDGFELPEVPAGDAWVWADMTRAPADLEARAARHSTEDAACFRESLGAGLSRLPGADAITRLAVSARVDAAIAVTAWADTEGADAAARLATALVGPSAAHGGVVRRQGDRVVATGTWEVR